MSPFSTSPGPRRFLFLLALYLVPHAIIRLLLWNSLEYDEAEQLLFAQSLALGYSPQPPLYTWLLWPLVRLFGANVFALTLLKVGVLAGVYLLLYRLAARLLKDGRLACLAAFSPLVTQVFAWEAIRMMTHTALVCLLCLASLHTLLRLRERSRTGDFVLLGVWAGLGLLSKYNYSLFAAALLGAALIVEPFRARLLDRRLALAAAVAVAVFAPHGFWLTGHWEEAREYVLQYSHVQRENGSRKGALVGMGSLAWSLALAAAGPALAAAVFLPMAFRRGGAQPGALRPRSGGEGFATGPPRPLYSGGEGLGVRGASAAGDSPLTPYPSPLKQGRGEGEADPSRPHRGGEGPWVEARGEQEPAHRLLAWSFLLALGLLVALVAAGVRGYRSHWFAPFLLLLPVWFFGRLHGAAVPRWRLGGYAAALTTAAAGVLLVRLAALAFDYESGKYQTRDFLYAELMERVRDAGLRPARVLAYDPVSVGYALLYFPEAKPRCLMFRSCRAAAAGEGPVLVLWDATPGAKYPGELREELAGRFGLAWERLASSHVEARPRVFKSSTTRLGFLLLAPAPAASSAEMPVRMSMTLLELPPAPATIRQGRDALAHR
jgi:4-amino-4-deoxy-L-arabinose transferase-like glycosyltransferase